MSVYAVAVDSQFVIKIWNYKTGIMQQSIQQSVLRMQDKISGLLIFSDGKFAVLSKHVTFYDTIVSRANDTGQNHKKLSRKELEIRRMILQEKGLSEIQ